MRAEPSSVLESLRHRLLVTLVNVAILSEPDRFGQIECNDGSGKTQLEDGLANTDTLLMAALGTASMTGARVASITGLVRFSHGSFEVHPRGANDIVVFAPPPSPPPPSLPPPSPRMVFDPPPMPRLEQKTSGGAEDNTSLIVGLTVGLVLASLFLAFAVFVTYTSRKRRAPRATLGAPVPVEMELPKGVAEVSSTTTTTTHPVPGPTGELAEDVKPQDKI